MNIAALRAILQGEHGAARYRPFEGEWPCQLNSRRHDFSLEPTGPTMLDRLKENGFLMFFYWQDLHYLCSPWHD